MGKINLEYGKEYTLTIKPHWSAGYPKKHYIDFDGEIKVYYAGYYEDDYPPNTPCECCGKERNKYHMFYDDIKLIDGENGGMIAVGTECVKKYCKESD